MPKIYTCDNCAYTTTLKADYTRHLKTKKHLLMKKNEQEKVKLQKALNQLKPKPDNGSNPDVLTCQYCQSNISGANHMPRHLRVCKKKDLVILQEKYNKLQESYDELKRNYDCLKAVIEKSK